MRKIIPITLILLTLTAAYLLIGYAPARAALLYGAPAQHLNDSQRIEYAARLLTYGDQLFTPPDPNGAPQTFTITAGETAPDVAQRLQQTQLIPNAQAFLDYLVYTGLDLTLQSGNHTLSPAQSMIEIARALQDSTPAEITLVIFPGWRIEEIAASLPTSGLQLPPQDFLRAAQTPPAILDFLPASASMEGFFLPYSYTLPRQTTAYQLLDLAARNFIQHITDDMKRAYESRGLNLYQAVTLASLIQRESIHDEEMPLIASVFYNRLQTGMTLGSDPTVQYALGYDTQNQTWWKNPLSLQDLKFDSPYNTYIYAGLPPAPIASPSFEALQAVAYPAQSSYYFFRARCDNTGYHVFSATLEEQIANACP